MAKPHKWKQRGQDLQEQPVEYEYQADKMSVMDQHEMVRRLAPPLVTSLEQLFGKLGDRNDPDTQRQVVAKVLAGFGQLPKEDHDWVLDALLSRVKRRRADQPTAQFADIWNGTGFMFDDIELGDMYAILREAGVFTFGNFMRMLQTIETG